MENDFQFNEEKTLAVFTEKQVVHDNYPILLVIHDEKGDKWEFLTGIDTNKNDRLTISLEQMLVHDSTLSELYNLPKGWKATRKSKYDTWDRTNIPPRGEIDHAIINKSTGLLMRPLIAKDYIILSGLIILLFGQLIFLKNISDFNRDYNRWVMVISWFSFFVFGVRFRNIGFSMIWLLLIICYIKVFKTHGSFLPVIEFIFYHVIRLIYWANYKTEFIPLAFSRMRGFIARFNKDVGRTGNEDDAIFTFILFFGSMILMEAYFKLIN